MNEEVVNMQEIIDKLTKMQKTIEEIDFLSYDKHTKVRNQKSINSFYKELEKMIKKLKKLQFDKELETYFENFNKKY